MIRFLRKLWKDKRGNVLIIMGAALPFLVGAAGLATDTIQWSVTKRELQRAADSAALAAVLSQVAGQTVSSGDCSKNYAVAEDEKNGNVTAKLGTTPTCTLTPSPTGWTAASYDAVQASMSTQQKLPFSSLFLTTAPTLSATATAAYLLSGNYCVVSLDNTVDTGITLAGSSTVTLGCGMKTDAKGDKAFDCTGATQVTATPIAAVGSINACASLLGNGTTLQPYAPPQTDPFASYSAPSVPNGCKNNNDVFPNGTSTTKVSVSGTSTSPKTVCYTDFTVGSGQTFTGSDLIVIINKDKNGNGTGGNFNIGSGGTVNCTRCVFILTTNNSSKSASIGTITVDAQATVNVSASTTNGYPNIAFFQDNRATCNNFCNTINGSSNLNLQGAVYLPTEGLQMTGTTDMHTNCLQIVAWQIKFAGNSTISNQCDDGTSGNTFKGYMVRLVA